MKRTDLSQLMKTAWQFFRTTGYEFSVCLKRAWANYKLLQALKNGIVRFYFQKVDGSLREAWGTLNEKYLPKVTGEDARRKNETVQVYFDTERQEWRCFKKLNLVA
ncbi:MAG: SH3 beta-barrel fold-containing protein [Mangrovibacterium sp.]